MKHITLFAAMAVTISMSAQIDDGSFEAGIGAGTWTEASVTFGTPLCDVASCGTCGGPCVPRTGDFYAWFGGASGGGETGSVAQDAFFPTGTDAALHLFVKLAALGDGSDENYLRVMVDGNEIDRITPADSITYADYTLWAIDVDSYADGAMHNVMIEGVQAAAAFNVLVDDVSLVVDGEEIVGLFENEELDGVSIYPNPANEVINFAFNSMSGNAQVMVTDISGKLVVANVLGEVSGRIFQMNTDELENGVYMISVQQGSKRFTERILIAH